MSNQWSFSNFFSTNPFAKYFSKGREKEDAIVSETMKNSVGVSQEELDSSTFRNSEYLVTPNNAITYIGTSFEQYFNSKTGRIQKYREMSFYPEINAALTMIADESIVTGEEGNCASLHIKKELPKHIEEQIRNEWTNFYNDIFMFNERGWDLFRKWLIDGEMYIELIISSDGKGIIGIKILPAHTMMPVYENSRIKSYIQTKRTQTNPNDIVNSHEEGSVIFDKDQVVYSNYGITGENLIDVRGYLEGTIKIYNMLKNIEDSLVVSRLNRAAQRRIWNIYTGRMPTGKANEYIKNLIQKYRKKITYNPENGTVDSSANIISLSEDFWFSKDENGNGTTVDNIGGDTSFISEIEDVKYFYSKLFKSLQIPQGRWSADSGTNAYSTGHSDSSNSREEIKFMKLIERLQRRFKYVLLDAFIVQLRLKGFDEQYTNLHLYDMEFAKSNLFKEYKELEMTTEKFNVLNTIKEFIYDAESNPTGYFAREFALKHFVMISDEQLERNDEYLAIEKADASKKGVKEKKTAEETPTTPEAAPGGEGMGGGSEAPPIEAEAPPEEITPEEEINSAIEALPEGMKNFGSTLLNEWVDDIKNN